MSANDLDQVALVEVLLVLLVNLGFVALADVRLLGDLTCLLVVDVLVLVRTSVLGCWSVLSWWSVLPSS